MVTRKIEPPAGMRPTIHALLKPRWSLQSDSHRFTTPSGRQEFLHDDHLPAETQIEHLVPRLQKGARKALSAAEKKLSRWVQIILPPGANAEKHLEELRSLPCIAEAHIVPPPSLPSPGMIPRPT